LGSIFRGGWGLIGGRIWRRRKREVERERVEESDVGE
jgi:hypothetical protein